MWVALNHETEDEAAKLRKAMADSLAEVEAERAAAEARPPLANLSEEKLRERFEDSALLKTVRRPLAHSQT